MLALLVLAAIGLSRDAAQAQGNDVPPVAGGCRVEVPIRTLEPLHQELLDSRATKGPWLAKPATDVQRLGSTALVLWAFTLSHQGPEKDRRRARGGMFERTYTEQLERGLEALLDAQLARGDTAERGRVGPPDDVFLHALATLALVDVAQFSEREALSERARLAVEHLLALRRQHDGWGPATAHDAAWADLALVVAAGRGMPGVAALDEAHDQVVAARTRELRHAIARGVEPGDELDVFRSVVVLDVAGAWEADRSFAQRVLDELEPRFPRGPLLDLAPEEALWTWSAELALTTEQSAWSARAMDELGRALCRMKPDAHTAIEWQAGPFGTPLDGAAMSQALYASRLCTPSSLEGRQWEANQ